MNRDRYMGSFKRVRAEILARDGGKCIKCGSTFTLEIHHIEGYRNNEPGFLATLCYLCHGVAPMGEQAFAQWLLLGESGMEVLRHKLATRGLKRMRREDIHAFLWALADFQFDMRNEQMRAAREKSRENGTWREGRKPYGTHPQEAKNVETMKRMAREG